jgi:hypothetical protein
MWFCTYERRSKPDCRSLFDLRSPIAWFSRSASGHPAALIIPERLWPFVLLRTKPQLRFDQRQLHNLVKNPLSFWTQGRRRGRSVAKIRHHRIDERLKWFNKTTPRFWVEKTQVDKAASLLLMQKSKLIVALLALPYSALRRTAVRPLRVTRGICCRNVSSSNRRIALRPWFVRLDVTSWGTSGIITASSHPAITPLQ